MPGSNIDLTTPEGVQHYLSQTPFAASSVTLLSGGTANFTYRIMLREPYVEPGSSKDGIRSMVLKHAEPYLAVDVNFPLAVERQEFEALALKHVSEMNFPSPVVSLPKLYHEDHERRVIIMTDCGSTSVTLKTLLLTNPPSTEVSHTIGHSLGSFLAHLHTATLDASEDNTTTTPRSQGTMLKAEFASYTLARSISVFATYGRLVETLEPSMQDRQPARQFITPPLDLSPPQLATITNVSQVMRDRIMNCNDVFTMGDFWPGNLIVSLDTDRALEAGVHVDIVDWEVAKPGLAGLDIGQFLAEMSQMRAFHPSSRASVDTIVSSFLSAYRDGFLKICSDKELVDVARVAATHVGAHLIAWTPRTAWGGSEKTREVVGEGVEYILSVVKGDEAWLRRSIVGGLLSG